MNLDRARCEMEESQILPYSALDSAALLASSSEPNRYHIFLISDKTVNSGLVSLWKTQLKHLSSWAEKVPMIRKSHDVLHRAIQVRPIRQDLRVEPFVLLKNIDGNDKDVLGSLIPQDILTTIKYHD